MLLNGQIMEIWLNREIQLSPWVALRLDETTRKIKKCWKQEGRKLAQNIDWFRESQGHFLLQLYITMHPETRNFIINKLVQIDVTAANGNKNSPGMVNLFNSRP